MGGDIKYLFVTNNKPRFKIQSLTRKSFSHLWMLTLQLYFVTECSPTKTPATSSWSSPRRDWATSVWTTERGRGWWRAPSSPPPATPRTPTSTLTSPPPDLASSPSLRARTPGPPPLPPGTITVGRVSSVVWCFFVSRYFRSISVEREGGGHLLLHLLIRRKPKYCKYYPLFILCLDGFKYPWLKRSKKICFIVKCIWSEAKYFKFEI